MPMYEYQCRDCGERFDELVSGSGVDDREITCPNCGKNNAERLMSAFASAGGGSSQPVSSGSSCGPSGFT